MKIASLANRKLRLILLRHAKAVQSERDIDDHDRPLAPRGVDASRLVGQMLADSRPVPDLVLCSTAVRTRETLALVAAQLPFPPDIRYHDELYDFGDGSAVLDVIRQEGGTAKCLMVVGHNPALEALATTLAGPGKDPLRTAMRSKFPTAAMAAFDCDLSRWADLDERSCEFVAFVRPADLMAG